MTTTMTTRSARWPRLWRMLAGAAIGACLLMLAAAAPAGAESEFCDDGSPPPNDFRLQPTGIGSFGAPPYWLRSTDGGDHLLESYLATGSLDLSQLGRLSGGVANGMAQAATNDGQGGR